MPRIRSIYPDILKSEDFASWSPWAQIAFVKIWTEMDDRGRIKDNPRWLAPILFPFNEEVGPAQMAQYISEWEATGSVCRYEAGDSRWIHAVNWDKYQKPNRPTESKIPPCLLHDVSRTAPRGLSEGSSPEGRGGEGRGEGGEGSASPLAEQRPRCPKHLNDPTNPPCGRCKEKRMNWERDQLDARPGLVIDLDGMRRG